MKQVPGLYSLRSQFDEFSKYRYSFAQTIRHTNFGDHPKLYFVKSTQKHVQVRCDLSKMMPSKCVIEKFIFVDTPRDNKLNLMNSD